MNTKITGSEIQEVKVMIEVKGLDFTRDNLSHNLTV